MDFTYDHKRVLLSKTDLAMLRTLQTVRYAYTQQFERIHFATGDPHTDGRRCRRALERLTHDQVLTRLTRRVGGIAAGSDQYIYTLGPVGQRLMYKRKRPRPVPSPSNKYLAHTLALTELVVRLRESERRGDFESIHIESEPTCWREFKAGSERLITLRPDLYVRLIQGAYEDAWFFELDRGTEGKRVIRGKLDLYRDYCASHIEQSEHGVFPQVLFLVPTPERRGFIREQIATQPAQTQELFRVGLYERTIEILGEPEPDNADGRIAKND